MKSISENISLSVLDLFSVLLPGFITELLLWQIPGLNQHLLNLFSFLDNDWQLAIAFFVGAYIIGHILFFLGSFLDPLLYDSLKNKLWDTRSLLNQVTIIKKKLLGFDDGSLLNTYKWSKAIFLVKHPSIYTLIESHEASSKFFRSLSLSMLLGSGIFFSIQNLQAALFSLLLMLLALTMYLKLRNKAIRTTYEHMLAIHGEMLDFKDSNNSLEEFNKKITMAEEKQKIKFFRKVLPDDIILKESGNGVMDKGSFIKELKNLKYNKFETRNVTVNVDEFKNNAIITCDQVAEGKLNGQLFQKKFKTIRFYQRQGTQWKIQAWHKERLNA